MDDNVLPFYNWLIALQQEFFCVASTDEGITANTFRIVLIDAHWM